jgi:DNA-binding MarR family transcriptional regulator
MFGVLSSKNEIKKFKDFQIGIKSAFEAVKIELDEHLDSINHGTREMQSMYDYMNELDAKIEKLNERIDELQMVVAPEPESRQPINLTMREQEVFLVLYSEENVTLNEMAKKLGFTEEMVNKYIYNLISKGIPVLREYSEKTLSFSLDLKFKDIQAKKNILNISESISKEILAEKTI